MGDGPTDSRPRVGPPSSSMIEMRRADYYGNIPLSLSLSLPFLYYPFVGPITSFLLDDKRMMVSARYASGSVGPADPRIQE